MIFTHHPQPGVEFTFADWRTYTQIHGNKPRGLWLSVDDDWARWVKGKNGPGWDLGDPVPFDVDLDRCLQVRTVAQIDAFHDKFSVHPDWAPEGFDWARVIDWPAVSEVYAGIIIAPYQHRRRFEGPVSNWYLSWDVASACVWDLSAVSVREHAERS